MELLFVESWSDASFLFDGKTLQQCLLTVFKGFCSFLMWTCVEVIWGLYNGAEFLHITRMTRNLISHTAFQLLREMHWAVHNYMHRFLSSVTPEMRIFQTISFKFNIIQDCQIGMWKNTTVLSLTPSIFSVTAATRFLRSELKFL